MEVKTISVNASSVGLEERSQEEFNKRLAAALAAGGVILAITHDTRAFRKAYVAFKTEGA